jgi:hypothetical protein
VEAGIVIPIDVEPDTYDAASKVFGQEITGELTTTFTGLDHELSSTAAMAGTDPGGSKWAASYDQAATATFDAMTTANDACFQLAAMLEMTGFNHGMAESHSDPTGQAPTPPDTTSYLPPGNSVSYEPPPSAAGGSGSPPDGWGLIQHLVGYVWPNGHQDKLRTAARAWSSAAGTLDIATGYVPEAVQAIDSQQSPEVADAVTVCQAMGQHIDDIAACCRSLSSACSDFAGHIDQAHSDVKHELVSLLEWSAGIEAGGAVLAVFSLGASEAAAQAAEAARIAATATRVGAIIGRLVDIAGTIAETIGNIVSKITEVAAKLRVILGARLSKAAVALAKRLPGIGKDGEELAADRLTSTTLSDYFAAGRTPTASELESYAREQGWTLRQTEAGPAKYVDDNGVVRLTLKKGSPRAPGSAGPHVEIRDADGNRIDPSGNVVTRKSAANHTSIIWDLG